MKQPPYMGNLPKTRLHSAPIRLIMNAAQKVEKVRTAMPQIMSPYDQNGWEMGMFYLGNGHAEIRGMLDLKEEFDA